MSAVRELGRRLWYLLNRRRLDAALREEMEAHRELMEDPRRFGNTLRLRQTADQVWGWAWLDGLWRDVRIAARGLAHHRGFAFVAVSSLALGFLLVSTTAAVTNAYLLQALPYGGAERLYHVMYAPPGPWEPRGLTAFDWDSVADTVEFPIQSAGAAFHLAGGSYAQSARGLRVTRGFVEGLEVRAALGRVLQEPDFRADAERVAMLGYDLWRERFGADPAVLGTTVTVETESREPSRESLRVIGVLPAGFYFGRDSSQRVDLLVPTTAPGRVYMIRLRPGVPPAAAEARLTSAVRQVASDLPGDWTGVRLEGVRDRYVGPLRTIILGVTAGSVFVLLIVATNLAVLTLLRTMRRRKELVVRTALGATRLQTVRLLAAESALVCLAGLAAGLALAGLVLPLLAPEIAIRLGKPAPGGEAALTVGVTVLASVSAIAVLIVLLLSTLPLLAGWHRDAATFLASDRSGASENRAMRRARGVLVAAQVAGTLVLLAGAFLLIRAVAGLLDTDLGFRPDGLVRGRIVVREQDHAGPDAFWQVRDRFAGQAGALLRAPVVFTSWPPFAERPAQMVEADSAGSAARRAGVIDVGHTYFEVLDVRLRQGRPFSAAEIQGDAPVAIVSETLARQFWPDGSGGGRRIRAIEPTPDGPRTDAWRTVIGVAADVRQGYSDAELADIYLPLSPADAGRFGTFYVRSQDSAAVLLPRLREAARGVDAHAIIDNVRLVSEENQPLEGARWLARVLTMAAGAALLLALVGIYGVMAYAVQQRGRETAIRIALGATAGAIRRMFLAECGMLVAAGLALGLFGSLALARWLAGQVPGVPGLSPGPIVAAAFVLGLSAALASWWPARRASLTDPGRGLRE